MELCSKCKKNPAVMFITKMEAGKTTSEGLCLPCAKALGIAPLNNMISQFGVSDDELDTLNSQMSEFIENISGDLPEDPEALSAMMEQISGGEDDEGGAATAPVGSLFNELGKIFGNEPKNDGAKAKNEKRAPFGGKKKKSMLDTYGTNLTAKEGIRIVLELKRMQM